jgi:hypothetical protein
VVWNHGWVWVPAPKHGPATRSVYAPALVAWVGGAGGNVGWFPLGPREVYVPGYPASQSYVRSINITNTTLITNSYITNVRNNITPQHYMNATAAAVTTVPGAAFTSGQRIGGHVVPVSSAMLATAGIAAVAPAIAPLRQSVLGPGETRVPGPPAALLQRAVVARTLPPAAPASFERQLAAIQRNGGKPLARSELAALQPAAPLAPVKILASRSPPAPGLATQGFAERERVLQQSALPPAPPRANPTPTASPANMSADAVVAAPQLASGADDATRAVDRPSSLPVYQFPPAADIPTHPPTATHPQQANPSIPPQPAPHPATPAPSPPAAHSSSPTHPQPSKEPRDSAPHGDRDSRERVLR